MWNIMHNIPNFCRSWRLQFACAMVLIAIFDHERTPSIDLPNHICGLRPFELQHFTRVVRRNFAFGDSCINFLNSLTRPK